MPINIGKDEQKRLRKSLLKYFANAPKQCAVLQFVFDRFIETGGAIEHISEQDIIDDCEGGPKNEGAVRTQINRLRADLASFFDDIPEGRSQRYKVLIPQRSYVLRFEMNEPSKNQPLDFVNRFWAPYTISPNPIHLYYPEQFFRDETQARPVQLPATSHQTRSDASNAAPRSGPASNCGFVPAGLVQAMVHLFGFFQRTRTPVEISALRPNVEMPEPDQDLIVLATPDSASQLLARLEVSLPYGTLPDRVVQRREGTSQRNFPDLPKPMTEGEIAVDLRWAVLTRRPHRIKGRIITVIAARHARVVEAIAFFLTQDKELHHLAHRFGSDGLFPTFFQALLSVPILRTETEPYIEPTTIEDVVNLDPPPHASGRGSLPIL